jgi:D-alanyl-D-alanine carboxypeptidase/D-alanyl-D-alanine-endopeptidase (penicillin-binding protein 4)
VTDSHDSQPTEALTRRSLRQSGTAAAPPPTAEGEPGAPTAKGGLSALIAKHPTIWLASALGVVFLLLGTGAVFAGIASGSNQPTVAAEPLPTETIDPRTQPANVPAASRLRTCSVSPQASDPRLTAFSGFVMNVNTGETLYDLNGTTPQRTGSVLKVLTAAAALSALGPGGQFTTQVLEGQSPGVIVLKGGGDPTLATTSATVYSGAPLIADLANAAMAAYESKHPDVPITQVILDSNMWSPSDRWDDSWLRKEQSDGYQAEVTALMVDGGRADPTSTVSSRTGDPIGDAGRAFVSAAGLGGVAVTESSGDNGVVLAEVKSQPISVLIDQMMAWSDNVMAENFARVTSKAMGFDGSSSSLGLAIPSALQAYNLDVTKVTIRDGSGLSDLNAVSPQFVSQLMIKVRAGEASLGVIYEALPVAGISGTLASRFTGANAIAAGNVVAKTGWLDSAYSLGGIVQAQDGTPLSFMVTSILDGISADAKEAQDSFVTGLFLCGDNLSNH